MLILSSDWSGGVRCGPEDGPGLHPPDPGHQDGVDQRGGGGDRVLQDRVGHLPPGRQVGHSGMSLERKEAS